VSESLSRRPLSSLVDRPGGQGRVLPENVARPVLFSAWAAAIDTALGLHLYLRPAPLGGPFALDPTPYVLRAIYYGIWAHALIGLPYVLFGWWRSRRGLGRSRAADATQLAISAALLCLGALDREVQRFLGMHASFAWAATYSALDRTPDVIWSTLRDDRGGAWSSLIGLAVALLYVPSALLWARRRLPAWLAQPRFSGSFAASFIVLPCLLWNFVPGGIQRLQKVRPALLTLWRELKQTPIERPDEGALRRAIALYQEDWLRRAPPATFIFDDADFPLRKRRLPRPAAVDAQPNIIVLSLETFRAKEMASFNPDAPQPSATPFLDQLAQRPDSAAFTRYYASGIPTVLAFMSIHTSLLSHPQRSVARDATSQHLTGFPEELRKVGYRTLHFTGSDPDWDSQRVWLKRWYDEVHYSPDDDELDRRTFRRASQRLREVGGAQQPFFAYLVSITNHTPFRNPEPELAVTRGSEPRDALRNTMRYTDDVVRELYQSLAAEPWFANTIWVITGDHAFDLGDRGEILGHSNLRHETTWVPLIVHGSDPRLPRGRNACVASHVDLAPTLSALAGVAAADSYMGHSLLDGSCTERTALILSGSHYAYETHDYSLYAAPGAAPVVYAGGDLEQRSALLQPPRAQLLVRYTVDFDRHSPSDAWKTPLAGVGSATPVAH
jgi:arylsulfatase A-like enzyme